MKKKSRKKESQWEKDSNGNFRQKIIAALPSFVVNAAAVFVWMCERSA